MSATDKIKKKYMFYLTTEADQYLREIYAFRLIKKTGKSRSDIICEALELLYKKEFKHFKDE